MDVGGTEERSTHYYIHARVRQASAGVYIREMKRKYGEYRGRTKETQAGNPKKRKNSAIRNNSINILRGTF